MKPPTKPLTWPEVYDAAGKMAIRISRLEICSSPIRIYGIPRGGIHAAQAVLGHMAVPSVITPQPQLADVIVDDLRDSGRTAKAHAQFGKPIMFLFDKQGEHKHWAGTWLEFPWEKQNGERSPTDAVMRLLQFIGENPTRDGLIDTPARVCRSLQEMCSGYHVDIGSLFTTFEETSDELVLCRDISFTSLCEHHMLPFHGVAHIGYIPRDKVVGLSKLTRLLDAYAQRLQVQERLTTQVTDALDEALDPRGSACVIKAHHQCMSCRGVRRNGTSMVTSSLTGAFRTNTDARAELLSLIGL